MVISPGLDDFELCNELLNRTIFSAVPLWGDIGIIEVGSIQPTMPRQELFVEDDSGMVGHFCLTYNITSDPRTEWVEWCKGANDTAMIYAAIDGNSGKLFAQMYWPQNAAIGEMMQVIGASGEAYADRILKLLFPTAQLIYHHYGAPSIVSSPLTKTYSFSTATKVTMITGNLVDTPERSHRTISVDSSSGVTVNLTYHNLLIPMGSNIGGTFTIGLKIGMNAVSGNSTLAGNWSIERMSRVMDIDAQSCMAIIQAYAALYEPPTALDLGGDRDYIRQ
jgi:hypothetical protein